jgi:hypothetical protein
MKPICPFCGYAFDHDAKKGKLYRCAQCRELFNVGDVAEDRQEPSEKIVNTPILDKKPCVPGPSSIESLVRPLRSRAIIVLEITCFILLAPASLTLGTGDPSGPSGIGCFFAIVSLLMILLLLRRPSSLALISSSLIFILALVTFVENPLGFIAEPKPIIWYLLYLFVARAGAATMLSAFAFFIVLYDRSNQGTRSSSENGKHASSRPSPKVFTSDEPGHPPSEQMTNNLLCQEESTLQLVTSDSVALGNQQTSLIANPVIGSSREPASIQTSPMTKTGPNALALKRAGVSCWLNRTVLLVLCLTVLTVISLLLVMVISHNRPCVRSLVLGKTTVLKKGEHRMAITIKRVREFPIWRTSDVSICVQNVGKVRYDGWCQKVVCVSKKDGEFHIHTVVVLLPVSSADRETWAYDVLKTGTVVETKGHWDLSLEPGETFVFVVPGGDNDALASLLFTGRLY